MVALAWCGCGAERTATPGATSAAHSVSRRRAIVTVDDVQVAARYEAALSESYDTLPPADAAWFTVLQGPSHVLVIAGHATSQMREGKLKPADAGTGSLAAALHRLAGTTVIQTTYASPSDPNFYDDNAFKREVRRLVEEIRPRLVLDLHASHPNHPYDVDFGTMEGRSLLGQVALLDHLEARLHEESISNLSWDFFSASKNHTIIKWVSRMGVPAVQCEINSTWLLPPSARPVASTGKAGATSQPADEWANALQYQRFAQVLQALVRFVREVDAGS